MTKLVRTSSMLIYSSINIEREGLVLFSFNLTSSLVFFLQTHAHREPRMSSFTYTRYNFYIKFMMIFLNKYSYLIS